ncbi:MAG: putative bifunctional diguanylate cyclase/phosphodiesterase [Gammaproteobacteria bacterium]
MIGLSLRRRSIAAAIAASLAALAVVLIVQIASMSTGGEDAARAALAARARALADALGPPLAAADRASAGRILAASDPGATAHARVIDAAGNEFAAHVADDEAGAMMESHPILVDGVAVGRIELRSASGAGGQQRAHPAWTFAAALAGLLLAGAVAVRMAGFVARPVADLAAALREAVGAGELSLRPAGTFAGELGELARALQSFLDEIRLRDRGLESQVRERTEELVRVNERLKHQAYHDALTRLPNRALFDDRLTLALAQAEREGARVAVLFLDLDDFKTVNDTLGHDSGDELLRIVANRLRESVRRIDTVARLGGDEFTMVLTRLDSVADAEAVGRTVIEALRQPITIGGTVLRITASVGVAVYPEHGTTVSVLKRNADTAMYCAKERGRDNMQFYSVQFDALRDQRLMLINDLEAGIERGELGVAYQPVLEAASGRIAAVEALARWQHPDHGAIAPSQFIPYAEEIGRIARIDRWIMQRTLGHLAHWRDAAGGPVAVSFNVALASVREEGFCAWLEAAARSAGAAPGDICLEIGERALMRATDADLALLAALRARGFRMAIDDFGSGYSAISYLPQCPVDLIKIDRTFMRDLARDRYRGAAVRAIAAMARSLDIGLIAKGVDDPATQDALRTIGIAMLQGDELARAAPADDIARMLAGQRRAAG